MYVYVCLYKKRCFTKTLHTLFAKAETFIKELNNKYMKHLYFEMRQHYDRYVVRKYRLMAGLTKFSILCF